MILLEIQITTQMLMIIVIIIIMIIITSNFDQQFWHSRSTIKVSVTFSTREKRALGSRNLNTQQHAFLPLFVFTQTEILKLRRRIFQVSSILLQLRLIKYKFVFQKSKDILKIVPFYTGTFRVKTLACLHVLVDFKICCVLLCFFRVTERNFLGVVKVKRQAHISWTNQKWGFGVVW